MYLLESFLLLLGSHAGVVDDLVKERGECLLGRGQTLVLVLLKRDLTAVVQRPRVVLAHVPDLTT